VPYSSDAFKEYKKTRPSKIHAIYEQGMFEVDTLALLGDVNTALQQPAPPEPVITSGHEAATALIELAYAAHKRLTPTRIINADKPDLTEKGRAERLWNNDDVREATIASLAESVRLLATLWRTAWGAGNGDQLPPATIREYTESEMKSIYRVEHDTFVPSLSLDEMAQSGNFEP